MKSKQLVIVLCILCLRNALTWCFQSVLHSSVNQYPLCINKPIYLLGMMGVGKTTVGTKLAQNMNKIFIDLDNEIENYVNISVANYVALFGIDQFRAVESLVLSKVAGMSNSIVATGGGIVEVEENWKYLETGLSIFLDLDAFSIYHRLRKNPHQIMKRPLLNNSNPLVTLVELEKKRREKYLRANIHFPLRSFMSSRYIANSIQRKLTEFLTLK